MTPTRQRPAHRWWPWAVDLLCVVALAVGGKSSHEASDSDWVVLVIAWPFALAATLAHLGLASRGRSARAVWPAGVVVLAVTYAVGMLLRAASGRGMAPAFLVVAASFLTVTMLGWRTLVHVGARRRQAR